MFHSLQSIAVVVVCSPLLGESTALAQRTVTTDRSLLQTIVSYDLSKLNSLSDTNARTYFSALTYALHNQPDKAQLLLKKAVSATNNPFAEPALDYLLKSFIANGQHDSYRRFADRLRIKPVFYADANAYASFPSPTLNFLTDIKAIPFRLLKKSYVVISTTINGHEARLLLDTGATLTVITEAMAKRAGIAVQASQTPVNTSTAAQITGSNALINRLNFGNIDVQNLPVKCFPSLVRGLRIDGLLGLDVLQKLAYTIDFKRRLCTFRRSVVYDMDSSANLFRERVSMLKVATPAGKPLYFVYDSGSNEFSLTTAAADNVTGYRRKKAKTRIKGLNGTRMTERTQRISRFQFSVAARPVTSERATFTHRETLVYGLPMDGITGNKPFRKGTLTIDFPNGQFTYKN